MDIEFGAYIIALRVRCVDNTEMVESGVSIREGCGNFSKQLRFSVELRPEQTQAATALLQSSDVLAVLPVRFGTSLIFQLFAAAAAIERNQHQTMLVVCSLQSVIIDY